jgi:hypothetical protein
MQPVTFAYIANIVMLGPIAVLTVFRIYPTDQGRFTESAGWRVLTGGLWSGILILSILGLAHPLRYSPVLLLQLIYKSIWLAVYVAPRLLRGDSKSIPWGMAGFFAAIVVVWPFLIPWQYLLGVTQ